MKTKTIPFDLETAKKIQAGEIKGRIVTNHGMVVTLVDAQYGFDEEHWIPIIWHWAKEHNELVLYNSKGECKNSHNSFYLHIELPEEAPKYEFKVGNKVRVNLPKDVVTKYLILGNYQGKVATIINVEGSYVKVKADGLQPYSFDIDYLIPYEEKHEFKPFDKVLVRDSDTEEWICAIFSHTRYIQSRLYVRSTNGYNLQCIPYEGNEHLVGTTDKPKEE